MIHAHDLDGEHREVARQWLIDHDVEPRAVYAVEVQSDHLVTVYRHVLPFEADARGDVKREAPLVVQAQRPFPVPEWCS